MKARHPLPLPPDMDCGFTAWTPSGVKREKHRAYNRLVSVIQRLCALCFSLLFFVLLKPKFSDEILDALIKELEPENLPKQYFFGTTHAIKMLHFKKVKREVVG